MANVIKRTMEYWPTTWWEYTLVAILSCAVVLALHNLFTISIDDVTVQYSDAWNDWQLRQESKEV